MNQLPQIVNLYIEDLEPNNGQLPGVPRNPRKWAKAELANLARSLKETPELFAMRPCIVYPFGRNYVVLGGNMRLAASKKNKLKDVPCIIVPAETPPEKQREIAAKDNGTFGEWDFDLLQDWKIDTSMEGWGIPTLQTSPVMTTTPAPADTSEADELARKKAEFEAKMAAGEISEEDEEYQEFLEKFKLKKTTDDCYTPVLIYEALAEWVAKKYDLPRSKFVRPFYPGGDYKNETYEDGCVVVDNPPFSILAEILAFYTERGIRFFLFASHLTLFSSSSGRCTALPVGVAVTYENGANVNTSFLTNLEDPSIRLRSEPSLYAVIKTANDENLAQTRKELPKYAYDHHVITSTFIGQLSRLGIDFVVPVQESEAVSYLDAQKPYGKAIYGKGYLISDRVFAEREKAEREKAERWERWELSERERERSSTD